MTNLLVFLETLINNLRDVKEIILGREYRIWNQEQSTEIYH